MIGWNPSARIRQVGIVVVIVAGFALLPSLALASYEKGLEAYQSSDIKTAVAAWTDAANDGDARSQFELGKLYEQGLGVLQELVEAHRWYNLSASGGVIDAVAARNAIEQKMSADEVKAARQLAAQWKPGQPTASGTSRPDESVASNQPASVSQQPRRTQALWQAAETGDAATTRKLLADGIDPNVADKDGWTALMFAAVSQHADVVALLLENGANPNLANKDGATPLMGAAATGSIEIAKLLTDANADISAKDKAGRTARELAEKAGHAEIAGLLSPKVVKPTKPTFDPQVQEAQRLLAQLGYSPGPADGVMGSRTKAAIRSFRKDNGLPNGNYLSPLFIRTLNTIATKAEEPKILANSLRSISFGKVKLGQINYSYRNCIPNIFVANGFELRSQLTYSGSMPGKSDGCGVIEQESVALLSSAGSSQSESCSNTCKTMFKKLNTWVRKQCSSGVIKNVNTNNNTTSIPPPIVENYKGVLCDFPDGELWLILVTGNTDMFSDTGTPEDFWAMRIDAYIDGSKNTEARRNTLRTRYLRK